MPWRFDFALQAGRLVSPPRHLWETETDAERVTDRTHQEPRYLFLSEQKRAVYYDQESDTSAVSRNTMHGYRKMAGTVVSERAPRGGKTNGNMKAAGQEDGSTVWLGRTR